MWIVSFMFVLFYKFQFKKWWPGKFYLLGIYIYPMTLAEYSSSCSM